MLTEETATLFSHWFDRGISESNNWTDGEKFSNFYRGLNVLMTELSRKGRDRDMLDWTKSTENILKAAFEQSLADDSFLDSCNYCNKCAPFVMAGQDLTLWL